MEHLNHPPYGYHNVGGSYYPQQQPLYPPPQGTYLTPMPPPPGQPYQQPPPSGPSPQGYFTNTNQQPPSTGGYGQPGMPPVQPPYTASYQQPAPQYQLEGHPSQYQSPSTGSFDPSVPQYAQQLSLPQTVGFAPPSPSASNRYNPRNPPPLPPRSPAAQMSFAPPPVTAISSKPTGTLGRLGARVAGTVQSKVKDYLAAKQENIQSASSGPKPSGTTPSATFMPSYGYNQPSQPWQAPSGGTQTYPASTVPPVSHVPPAAGEYQSAPSPHLYGVNQATSSTTSEPQSNGSMCATVSPPMVNASAPSALSISSSRQPQGSAPTPLTAASSTPLQHLNTCHPDQKPTTEPIAHQTENPVTQPSSTIEASRPSQPGQVPEQSPQTVHTSGATSMTWGWNLTFNPASQPLGQFVPQLNLRPMFTKPSTSPAVSDTAAQTKAPPASVTISQSLDLSTPPPPLDESTSHQTVLAELPADQAPRLPEKLPLQAVSQSSRPSTEPPAHSSSESVGFQPYRPTVVAQGPKAQRPIIASGNSAGPNEKPKPKPQKFQPYRAPETLSKQSRDRDQTSGGQPPPSKPVSTTNPTSASHSTSVPEPRVPTSAMPTSMTALGDLITNHIQNLTVSSTPPAPVSAQLGIPTQNGPGSDSTSSSSQNPPAEKTNGSSSTTTVGDRPQSIYHEEYCPYPMLATPMLAHGSSTAPPDSFKPQPSRLCFEAEPAPFPRSYYRHPEALSFPICTWCFNTYIAHTSLASAFPESLVVRAEMVVCGFHLPRITKCLWPAAVRSGDLTDLIRFMEKRYPTLPSASADPNSNTETTEASHSKVELKLIKRCKRGGQHVDAHEGYTWYKASTPSPSAPDLMVCEACYEDFVLATPAFAANFTGPLAHPEYETLSCAIAAHPYIQRALFRYGGSATPNWEALVQAADMRLELTQNAATASCDGLSRRFNSCRWWTLKGYEKVIPSLRLEPNGYSSFGRIQARNHFIICESCYLDAVAGTRFEPIFCMVAEPPLEDVSVWDDERYNLSRWCTYSAGKNHAVLDAFWAANKRKLSPQTLDSMLEEIASKPRCGQVPEGMHDSLFYNFPGAERVDDFGICEGHYVSTVKGSGGGLEQFFADSPVQVPGQAYCAFHPAVLRVDQWIHKFNEAIDTGDFSIYRENVRKFAGVPLCPGRDAVHNRRWYGWPDCAICPDCFEQFATGTKLADEMPWKNELAEYWVICSMYSTRQREMYSRACETGDVEGLLAACTERTKIWNRTVPRMTVLAAQRSIANGGAMLAAQMARGHAMSNAVSFGDDGTRWTTSSGNTYQSYNGVLAEKYRNEAEAFESNVRGLDPTSEHIHLAVLWESVE